MFVSPHVDLAGDGSGDEGGAAFLKKLDGSFGFRLKLREPDDFAIQKLSDFSLFVYGWNRDMASDEFCV